MSERKYEDKELLDSQKPKESLLDMREKFRQRHKKEVEKKKMALKEYAKLDDIKIRKNVPETQLRQQQFEEAFRPGH